MMTEEELQEALKWRKTDKLIEGMLSHIDDQASQITTLKAICTKERFWQIWKAGECQTVERATQKAKDQLAKEYPEINWDE